MSIDGCEHSLNALWGEVFPNYLNRLRWEMTSPRAMELFARKGVGTVSLLRRFELSDDFSGCYVLMDGMDPIYVGISRKVIQRLQQHVKGKTHFDASLAYRMAKTELPHASTRAEAMNDPAFETEFIRAKKYIQTLEVSFIPIDNPLELYLISGVLCDRVGHRRMERVCDSLGRTSENITQESDSEGDWSTSAIGSNWPKIQKHAILCRALVSTGAGIGGVVLKLHYAPPAAAYLIESSLMCR